MATAPGRLYHHFVSATGKPWPEWRVQAASYYSAACRIRISIERETVTIEHARPFDISFMRPFGEDVTGLTCLKAYCTTAMATVAGLSGICLAWYLTTFDHLARCDIDPAGEQCRLRNVLDLDAAFSWDALLTTALSSVVCFCVAGVLTVWFIAGGARNREWIRNFSIVGVSGLAAVAATAGPAIALAVVDSAPVPKDRSYFAVLLAAFSLTAGVCFTLLVALGVAITTGTARSLGTGAAGLGRLPLALIFIAVVCSPVVVEAIWLARGHPDLPFLDLRRPVEAGIWFGVLVAASMAVATLMASVFRHRGVLSGLLAMGMMLLAPAVSAPALHTALASFQRFYLSDTPAPWVIAAHVAFVVLGIPFLAVGLPILLGAAHAASRKMYQSSNRMSGIDSA